ncbi:phosphopyruvate hydratase [Thiomonas bhubaneswarensis]|uniref:Enolase n=1 Tax=Thiomonas bhubaneswarensis TaxID=339866 RepID=A0A0K6I9A1_9BURK|nr:phosphopyruvate hydratase [Thiomonas bhubaneswarensis]CUA99696.1 enolase [Thiomonas bhubaneswarensis]
MNVQLQSPIAAIDAMEILDSRGVPTIKARVVLQSGASGAAAVPSGASTGSEEAVELRDGDPHRYFGKGVRKVVAHVQGEIAKGLVGRNALDQQAIDARLIELDGTPNKARLGANALLAVSMATARAAAVERDLPLYRSLGVGKADLLPMPMFNVLNGGLHAPSSSMDFQEFMLVPLGAPGFTEAVRYAAETFDALRKLLQSMGHSTSVGDEGGFAPRLGNGNAAACELIVRAIERAGYRPGIDLAIALDPAATSFYQEGEYRLTRSGHQRYSSEQMIDLYADWLSAYPIVSIEDGMAEDDWSGFAQMTRRLGERIQIVGDDNFVTNVRFIQRGIDEGTANASLIKLNQIGTVSETVEAVQLCQRAGWRTVISHRSGETEDPFIADFAVAVDAGQMKSGSLSRSERLAKYNRLLEIDAELGERARFVNPYR